MLAVKVIGKVPVTVGVPVSEPAVKVTPVGRGPVSPKVGVGVPVAVTVKVPAMPSLKVVASAEVIVGADAYGQGEALGGVGEDPVAGGEGDREGAGRPSGCRVSEPPVKVTPVGRGPVSVMVGAGKPVAVGVKELAAPSVKVALLAEVNDGGPPTVRVKAWVAGLPMPLVAVKVIGKVPLSVGVPVSEPPVKVPRWAECPVSVTVGVGVPVAVGVKELGVALGEAGVVGRGDGCEGAAARPGYRRPGEAVGIGAARGEGDLGVPVVGEDARAVGAGQAGLPDSGRTPRVKKVGKVIDPPATNGSHSKSLGISMIWPVFWAVLIGP